MERVIIFSEYTNDFFLDLEILLHSQIIFYQLHSFAFVISRSSINEFTGYSAQIGFDCSPPSRFAIFNFAKHGNKIIKNGNISRYGDSRKGIACNQRMKSKMKTD